MKSLKDANIICRLMNKKAGYTKYKVEKHDCGYDIVLNGQSNPQPISMVECCLEFADAEFTPATPEEVKPKKRGRKTKSQN